MDGRIRNADDTNNYNNVQIVFEYVLTLCQIIFLAKFLLCKITTGLFITMPVHVHVHQDCKKKLAAADLCTVQTGREKDRMRQEKEQDKHVCRSRQTAHSADTVHVCVPHRWRCAGENTVRLISLRIVYISNGFPWMVLFCLSVKLSSHWSEWKKINIV